MGRKKKHRDPNDPLPVRRKGTDSRVGAPERWSVRALLAAYVEAQQAHDPNAEAYATLLRARNAAVPRVRTEMIKIGQPPTVPRVLYSVKLVENKRVEVVAGDVTIGRYPVIGMMTDWKRLVDQHEKTPGAVFFEWIDGKRCEIVRVPAEESHLDTVIFGQSYSGGKKRPLMCVYDATKSYCESMLGVKLSTEDEDFFVNHPLTDTDGVSFPNTLRVIQEVIAPYRLRVSRVQLTSGYNVKGDILQWRGVLGCNPLALTNRFTTNAEFIEKAEGHGTPGHWRFEYTTDVLAPSISCGLVTAGNEQTGYSGGHAVYVPPRRRIVGAMLSLQIDREEAVPWKKLPVFEALPAKGPPVLPAEEPFDAFDLDAWYRLSYKTPKDSKGWAFWSKDKKVDTNGIKVTQVPAGAETKETKGTKETTYAKGSLNHWFDPFICRMCNRPREKQTHQLMVPGLCDACWKLVADLPACGSPTCKLITEQAPMRYHSHDWANRVITLECPTCQHRWSLTPQFEGGKTTITRALTGLHAYAIDLEIERETTAKGKVSGGEAKQESSTDDHEFYC